MTASLPVKIGAGRGSSLDPSRMEDNFNGPPPTQQQHHHRHKHQLDLVLNKVELSKIEDCFHHQDLKEVSREQVKNLICANGINQQQQHESRRRADLFGTPPPTDEHHNQENAAATRVLICSQSITKASKGLDSNSNSRLVQVAALVARPQVGTILPGEIEMELIKQTAMPT
jgi:hypothetical protein